MSKKITILMLMLATHLSQTQAAGAVPPVANLGVVVAGVNGALNLAPVQPAVQQAAPAPAVFNAPPQQVAGQPVRRRRRS